MKKGTWNVPNISLVNESLEDRGIRKRSSFSLKKGSFRDFHRPNPFFLVE